MNHPELHLLRGLVRELATLAEEADLTGRSSEGAPHAIRKYNQVLSRLSELELVPSTLFAPLDASDGFGVLAVEAKLLMAALAQEPAATTEARAQVDPSLLVRLAPFVKGEDLANLVRECTAQSVVISDHIITSIAPFLDSDSLGKLVRDQLIGNRAKPPVPPAPPAPPAPPEVTIARYGESAHEIVLRLSEPSISDQERQTLAARLYELTKQDAQ